jgi:hypothetical protein
MVTDNTRVITSVRIRIALPLWTEADIIVQRQGSGIRGQ